jgi:biopolymer transport protein ExbB
MLNILLQASTLPIESEETTRQSLSVLELLFTGGFMMIPILLLWIVAIYIFIERVLTIRKAGQTPTDFKDRIRSMVTRGDIQGGRLLCVQTDTPVARMIEKGLSRIGSSMKNIEVSIENIGKIELNRLEKNLSLLATISGVAPMMGFLGTVTGMIQAFMAIAQEEGAVSPKLLSAGIYEAMLTTAAGLFVGILSYLGYNYLVHRMQKVVHTMEYTAIDFMDLLQEPQKNPS